MELFSTLIAQKERECAELAHRLEIAQAELRVLKLAAETISRGVTKGSPEHPINGSSHEPARRWGKTLWSLSGPYRKLVEAIIAKGNPAMNSYQISALAKTVGLELTPKQASGRFRKYVISGMAEKIGDQYRLTEPAVRTFGQDAATVA